MIIFLILCNKIKKICEILLFLSLFRFTFNVSDGAVAKITMTMDVSKSETNKNGSTQQECAGCGKTITER